MSTLSKITFEDSLCLRISYLIKITQLRFTKKLKINQKCKIVN